MLSGTFAARSKTNVQPKAAKEPEGSARRNNETNLLHPDSFNISPKPNTDGMGNCLQQPGQLSNQPLKSMLVT